MKKTVRFTAKKVEDAISQGLEVLGVTIAEAEIQVISTGGLFKKAEVEITIGTDDEPTAAAEAPVEKPVVKAEAVKPSQKHESVKSKAEVPVKPEAASQTRPQKAQDSLQTPDSGKPAAEKDRSAQGKKPQGKGQGKPQEKKRHEPRPSAPATPEIQQKAEEFLGNVLKLSGIEAGLKSDTADGLSIAIETEDSTVIGHRGETLDAFQYLTSLIINGGPNKYVSVSVDALGYRTRRAESLQRLAQKMAEKCIAQNRRVSLESMNNSDRKEIHAYLAENDKVVTRSEGNEPNRRIVIYPAR